VLLTFFFADDEIGIRKEDEDPQKSLLSSKAYVNSLT
jgi:hypothetical protein